MPPCPQPDPLVEAAQLFRILESDVGDLEARVIGIALNDKRLVSRAEISCPEVRNRRDADAVRQCPGRVGPEAIHDGEQVGVIRLEAVDGGRETGEELLWSAIVAGAGVGERAQQREPVSNAGVAWQQLRE